MNILIIAKINQNVEHLLLNNNKFLNDNSGKKLLEVTNKHKNLSLLTING